MQAIKLDKIHILFKPISKLQHLLPWVHNVSALRCSALLSQPGLVEQDDILLQADAFRHTLRTPNTHTTNPPHTNTAILSCVIKLTR